MPNKHLKNKIKNYELRRHIIIFFFTLFVFFIGKYSSLSSNLLNFVVGSVLGIVGVMALFTIEYYTKRQIPYEKGLKLEMQVEEKLKGLKINYEQSINIGYGDLDFFIVKGNSYYGIEAKNYPGNVIFEDGLLKINDFNNTNILDTLLNRCRLVRNLKFGENPNKFVKPILVFGYKTIVNIPQNKIKFNNTEIIVATIKDFDRYI